MSPVDPMMMTNMPVIMNGPRNKDGLLIPSTRLFGLLLGIYKILLCISSVILFFGLFVIIFYDDMIQAMEERTKEKPEPKIDQAIEYLRRAKGLVIVAYAFGVLQNVIGWICVKTLRMRYLWVNLLIQCMVLGSWIASAFRDDVGGDFNTYSMIWAQVAEVLLICILMREIRLANSSN